MLTLVKNARSISTGRVADILCAGGRIVFTSERIDAPAGAPVEVLDIEGRTVVPGLVDGHVHFIGAAGDEGLSSHTPPISTRHLLQAGVTTAVGCLGFGRATESVRHLYVKACTMSSEGASTYIYSGSFFVPPATITGSVGEDILLVDKVLGVKIAVADAYSSHPTVPEISRIAGEAFVAGLQAGKAGIVHAHIGQQGDGFDLLEQVQRATGIPKKQFIPTHCNWSSDMIARAAGYAKRGGYIDLSTVLDPARGSISSVRASLAVMRLLDNGVPASSISLSSDGNVGMPVRDPDGVQTGLYLERVGSLWDEVSSLARQGMPLDKAVSLASENPARRLGLFPGKGSIDDGSDADIIALNEDLTIHAVLAGGKTLRAPRLAVGD